MIKTLIFSFFRVIPSFSFANKPFFRVNSSSLTGLFGVNSNKRPPTVRARSDHARSAWSRVSTRDVGGRLLELTPKGLSITTYVSLLLTTSSEHYEDIYICTKVFIYSVTNGYKIQSSSLFKKLIPYAVHKYRNSSIAWPSCRAGLATGYGPWWSGEITLSKTA